MACEYGSQFVGRRSLLFSLHGAARERRHGRASFFFKKKRWEKGAPCHLLVLQRNPRAGTTTACPRNKIGPATKEPAMPTRPQKREREREGPYSKRTTMDHKNDYLCVFIGTAPCRAEDSPFGRATGFPGVSSNTCPCMHCARPRSRPGASSLCRRWVRSYNGA